MIVLDLVVYKVYVEVHPSAKTFISKPLDNYKGLKIICGDDHATSSYAKSIFGNFGERVDLEDNMRGDATPVAPNIVRLNENNTEPLPSPSSSTSVRPIHEKKRAKEGRAPVINHLIDVVEKVADAIKNRTHALVISVV
ncbi:hypothetical protein J5N97_010080 [Dioscorea zingiberensis]|uniref:Uncharacterized protein n=1 Tax=Dioscorea zingiberensis TaxID=325984 RepID=A0A9D5HM53_9LILI|nr:hypothetical protein J5N97_010080 [Dioscorea zingiberensis]